MPPTQLHTAPTVSIATPLEAAVVTQGDSITFDGSANDAEDGDITANLAWTSSLDGPIGVGGTFARSDLSVGVHTITAAVIDDRKDEKVTRDTMRTPSVNARSCHDVGLISELPGVTCVSAQCIEAKYLII